MRRISAVLLLLALVIALPGIATAVATETATPTPTPATPLSVVLSMFFSADTVLWNNQTTVIIQASNSGGSDIDLNQFKVILPNSPGTPTIVPGSSTFPGLGTLPDPVDLGGGAWGWNGPFSIPHNASAQLRFNLSFPQTEGGYVLVTTALEGSAQVDTTTDPLDNAPAIGTVTVILPTPTFSISPTHSVTPTQTRTPSDSPTRTLSPTPSATPTLTRSPSDSPTRTVSPTPSYSPSSTKTATATLIPSLSPSLTQTFSVSPTRTRSPTPDRNVELKILELYPHPIGAGGTQIVLKIPGPCILTLRIFGLGGDLVYQTSRDFSSKGIVQVPWDAKNSAGNPVVFGQYYLVADAAGSGTGLALRASRWITVAR